MYLKICVFFKIEISQTMTFSVTNNKHTNDLTLGSGSSNQPGMALTLFPMNYPEETKFEPTILNRVHTFLFWFQALPADAAASIAHYIVTATSTSVPLTTRSWRKRKSGRTTPSSLPPRLRRSRTFSVTLEIRIQIKTIKGSLNSKWRLSHIWEFFLGNFESFLGT